MSDRIDAGEEALRFKAWGRRCYHEKIRFRASVAAFGVALQAP
jgi:hypothetical protein